MAEKSDDTAVLDRPSVPWALAFAPVVVVIALNFALVASIVLVLATSWTRITDVKGAVNEGTMGSLLPIFNTASEVGYGAVIASLAAFTTIKDAVLGVSGNPLVSLGVVAVLIPVVALVAVIVLGPLFGSF